jgi:hypothetical protein
VEDNAEESRKAIMAIEPVDSHLAGEERFKCIQSVRDYYVVTANSAGVVSLMNLQGAINMMMSGPESEDEDENSLPEDDESEEQESDNDDDTELAVDIVESVRLGTGARITCLAAWCKTKESQFDEAEQQKVIDKIKKEKEKEPAVKQSTYKRTFDQAEEYMDPDAVKKARSLVKKAKKLKSKREKKKIKK